MTTGSDRAALDAFAAWLDDPTLVRDARLADRLRDAPDLAAPVARLIRAHGDAAMLPTEPPVPAAPVAARAWPARVGPYRLVAMIGEGGMGAVFRGERDDGLFTQTVAIKLIRRTLFAATAADQFGIERQILARLRHPHIAQLFDGGVTVDGDPFIVMELIDGTAIGDHCAARGLDRRGRVALLRDVCAAVQFAHQNLIVHADIKPGNILIDPRHGVKLLDFGIARLLDGGPGAPDGARTPDYGSPARLAGVAAVPADDVFALGRVTAELLDDGTPLPAQLAGIVARATAPDPVDRYPSVEAFAADLDRWQRGQPVRALPAPPARVAAMFIRRHPAASAATAAAVAGLLLAVGVTTHLYVRAETARASAERRFDEVRQLSRYLLTDLTDQLQGFAGTAGLRHDLAAKGRTYLEALDRVPDAPRDVRLEVARGYVTTARIAGQPGLQSLGDPVGAKRDLARAEAILDGMGSAAHNPAADLTRADLLTTRAGIVHVLDNHAAAALPLYAAACRLADRAAGGQPTAATALARARCLLGIANIGDYEAHYDAMRAPLAGVLAALDFAPGIDPVTARQLRGNTLILSGDVDYYSGDKLRALADYRAAADTLATGSATSAADARLLDRGAWADYNVASTLDDIGRHAEALAAVDRGVAHADLVLSLREKPAIVAHGRHPSHAAGGHPWLAAPFPGRDRRR